MMGKNNLLHKAAAVLVFIAISTIVFYLFYLNSRHRESAESAYQTKIEVEPIENYEIRERPEGRFIANDRARFATMIPANWDVKMVNESEEVKLLSPNTIINQEDLFPSKGCVIGMTIEHFAPPFSGQADGPENIRRQIDGDLALLEGAQEVIAVDNKSALKTFTERDRGGLVIIKLPVGNTIYHFGLTYSLNNKNECLDGLNQVIDSVSVN